jgi:hypothetical protein
VYFFVRIQAGASKIKGSYNYVLSTDHKLIPASNASLAAMHGSASGMFVTIQRENIPPSKKKMNKAVTMLKLHDVCS